LPIVEGYMQSEKEQTTYLSHGVGTAVVGRNQTLYCHCAICGMLFCLVLIQPLRDIKSETPYPRASMRLQISKAEPSR
jgi:hypothetical protein